MLNKWKEIEPLDEGGQGFTYLVENSQKERFVMKKLRDNKNPKARLRMYSEVAHLKILAQTGAKVPHVVDDNTNEHATDHELYFVMDFIDGVRLDEFVQREEITLEKAINITLSLAETMNFAHNESILHRDIKPANIIFSVKDECPYFVDFGLSYNTEERTDMTEVSERIQNKFLSFPERIVKGSNTRDPRSDVTGLVGVLFYCLTKEYPEALIDGNNLNPHRRIKVDYSRLACGEIRKSLIEDLFNKGFRQDPNQRFQNINDLVAQLDYIKNVDETKKISPIEEANRINNRLEQDDIKTRMEKYRNHNKFLVPLINRLVKNYTSLPSFEIGVVQPSSIPIPLDIGLEKVSQIIGYQIKFKVHPQIIRAAYFISSNISGELTVLFYYVIHVNPIVNPRSYKKILSYYYPDIPAEDLLKRNFDEGLIEVMKILEKMCLGDP